jgi:outer membrane protein
MKKIEWILLVAVVISIVIGVLNFTSKTTVAYVRTNDLLQQYTGMEEAVQNYERQMSYWQSKLDSIQKELHLEITNYNADSLEYSRNEKLVRKENIRALQFEYQQLNYQLKEKAKVEDQKIMISILNQVNSFIHEYGEQNKYDIIFGTLETGNVIYGKDNLDITEELIYELNKSYSGE